MKLSEKNRGISFLIISGVIKKLFNPLQPVLLFYTPENIRKPLGFLFSRGIEKQHWAVIG